MDAKKLGKFIAEQRKNNHLTQAALAEKLHVTDKAVSKWERGLGFPDINTIEPLAEALGVSVLEIMKAEKIEKCLADGLIRDYIIEVHALKNTARMIGAMELSKWCYDLEMAGNAGQTELLEEQTSGMLQLYRSYKEVLKPYAQMQNGEKQQVPDEKIIASLRELRDAMDTFDLDKADEVMKQIEEFQLDETLEPLMDELRAYVADVAMEEVMCTADLMIKMLEEK